MSASLRQNSLARHDGSAVLSMAEAMLKGILEGEAVVNHFLLTASRSTRSLQIAVKSREVQEILRRHRIVPRIVEDASRAVELAGWGATENKRVAVIAAGPTAAATVRMLTQLPAFASTESMAVLLEAAVDFEGLRAQLAHSEIPLIEVVGVNHVRDAADHALRLSRAANRPCVLIADPSLMTTFTTVDLHPNRQADHHPAGPPRRRGPRREELGGPLRIARRLELNQARSMPSPGETAELGFIVSGRADRVLRRMEIILGVEGRLPTLHLGLVHPIDEAAIERILRRCRTAVVLEPSDSWVTQAVRAVSSRLIGEGEACAAIWARPVMKWPSSLHPSVLARELAPLIERVVSGDPLASRLAPEPPDAPPQGVVTRLGDLGHVDELRSMVKQAVTVDIYAESSEDEGEGTDASSEPICWLIDRQVFGPAEGRRVVVECWSEGSLRRRGAAAVRQAVLDEGAWLILIGTGPNRASDVERLVGGMVPTDRVARLRIRRYSSRAAVELQRGIRESANWIGLTVLVVEDGPPPRFEVASMEQSLADIDRVGYQQHQRVTLPADEACVIRQPPTDRLRDLRRVDEAIFTRTTIKVNSVSLRWPPAIGGRVRPLVEQVQVERIQPPTRGLISADLPLPKTFLHADQPIWTAHLAGLRGPSPGVCGLVLSEAGQHAGYHVELQADPTPIGPGRRRGAQIAFARPRDQHEASAVTPVIPWAEADVLIGIDLNEAINSVSPEAGLRVASASRTTIAVNTGRFEDQLDSPADEDDVLIAKRQYLEGQGIPGLRLVADVTSACRYRFHNERLADMVLLGAVWQQGAVPLSLDAMHRGLAAVEASGWARLREAFEFGRTVGVDPAGLLQTHEQDVESASKSLRRYRLVLARGRFAGQDRADRFRRLADRVAGEVPGLLETAGGRAAHRDFIVALRRCVTWGGFDLAERFADRIISLYEADRADTGRAMARAAVLPLAEATLIRDAIYVASMSISVEHRRRMRRRLNVKRQRGDRVMVRSLTRLEFTFIRWRIGIDLRTSDWLAHLLAALRWVVPSNWRGRPASRKVRTIVTEAVMQAASAPHEEYGQWRAVLEQLHALALDGRLRRISPASLRRNVREILERV